MKKLVSLLLALTLVLSLAPAALAADVRPSVQRFTVDGKPVSCTAYAIDGYNYVMLRGLAGLLNGTDRQFSVTWDGQADTVRLETGKAYVPDGAVWNGPAVTLDESGRVTSAPQSARTLVIDGRTVTGLTAYTIGGFHFFKLRDLQPYLGFGLVWDGAANTVRITTGVPEIQGLAPAGDYGQIYASLDAARSARNSAARSGGGGAVLTEEAAEAETFDAPVAAPVAEAPAASEDGAADVGGAKEFSGTNVQVEGIDEGDIVKTDGTYLYILRGHRLLIARAEGKSTRILSETKVGLSESNESKTGYSSRDKEPMELYVSGDRVAVLSGCYESSGDYSGKERTWTHREYTAVDLYDVSDPAHPKAAAQLGQDGNVMGSRLKDGTLYLVTNYYVYDWNKDQPETYVPCLYRGGRAVPVAAGDIWLCPGPGGESTSYAVVTAYDLAGGAASATRSILGGGNTLYMSHDSIYVANSRYAETISQPRTESVYTVVDHNYARETRISRFDLAGGLEVAASGTVPGGLDDQFSMDEYQGNLRLVVTTEGYSYTTYTDEAMKFENYRWHEDQETANGLYILGPDLSVLGSVKDLAPGEQVYSARFDGGIAYFCTYRNVDPLFAVDVSDPTAPKVLSALKISGFSEYLHPWGDGRLLGVGYEADEETGRTEGVKLVMFNTDDKTDVTALTSLMTDLSSSEAMYNHKAFLISPAKGLLAFPADKGYCFFRYEEGKGFTRAATVDLGEWSYESRGLYIGDTIYVVGSDAIYVIDMNSLTRTAEIPLPAEK